MEQHIDQLPNYPARLECGFGIAEEGSLHNVKPKAYDPSDFNFGISSQNWIFNTQGCTLISQDFNKLIIEVNTNKFFIEHPRCAVISFRIVDEDGLSARRHNPRLGHFLVDKPGMVGTFLGGACAIRRSAFEACGGYDDSFFYSMVSFP